MAVLILSTNAPSVILASSFRQTNQPIITHQYQTTGDKSTRIVIIPLGAAEKDVAKYYQPDNVTIPNGTAMTWINHDTAVHTATANDASYSFDTGIIPVGANATVFIRGEQGDIQYSNAGKEIWWKTMGTQYHADTIPERNGSGIVWTYGIDNYHAVDNNTLYVTTNGRGLNFFTNGIVGYKTPTTNAVELGYHNGTITAIDAGTGKIKWEHNVGFPPLVSPLVTNGVVFSGYIPFVEKPSIKYTTTPSGIPKK